MVFHSLVQQQQSPLHNFVLPELKLTKKEVRQTGLKKSDSASDGDGDGDDGGRDRRRKIWLFSVEIWFKILYLKKISVLALPYQEENHLGLKKKEISMAAV
ncbi:hypothetical protein QYF36_021765 [Acer negundo]|nr:hypothetical protein QYF36_021765 [Acer negundo]